MINVKVGLNRLREAGLKQGGQGTVPYVVAGWLVLVVGVGALTVEFGRLSNDRRMAQIATNQAAVAAAGNLMRAEGFAAAALSGSRIADNSELIVVRGRYRNDPLVPKEQRFQPDPVNANAARVTVRSEAPLHVGRLFTGASSYSIAAEATATNTAFGALAIGGRTLSLQDGLLNQILSGLLGARIELSPSDYRVLSSARIDLFRYLQALAAELSLSSASYDRLVRQSVSASDALEAFAKAVRTEDGAETAASEVLDTLVSATARSAGSLVIARLFSPGPHGSLTAAERPGGPALTVSALDLLNAVAQAASVTRQAEAEIALAVPGIVGATVRLAFAERPSGMSWIKAGAESTNIQTVQTRAFVKLKLQGPGALSLVELPITIEVGNAMAQLSSISCDHLRPALSTMRVDARPGAVDAWIGEADGSFASMTAVLRPGAARIVDLPVLRVSGGAAIAVNNLHPNTLTFTQAEAQMRLVKSVGTRDFTHTLVTRLLQNLQVVIEKREAADGVPITPAKTIGEMLNAAQPSIERALAGTLDALGVSVGRVDVMPLGLRCDGAVLVQ
jgi:uncharacterized membrane protein